MLSKGFLVQNRHSCFPFDGTYCRCAYIPNSPTQTSFLTIPDQDPRQRVDSAMRAQQTALRVVLRVISAKLDGTSYKPVHTPAQTWGKQGNSPMSRFWAMTPHQRDDPEFLLLRANRTCALPSLGIQLVVS
jgi:hypothetical protein